MRPENAPNEAGSRGVSGRNHDGFPAVLTYLLVLKLTGLVVVRERKREALDAGRLTMRLADLQNGRDEMNLCELQFATLSERSDGRDTLRHEVEDFDRQLGQSVQRTLTVKGDPDFGLPTAKDEEIYLGLLKYTSDYNGFADPEVQFSRAALFDLMDWPKSDWAYARLTKGMHRLVGVRLSYRKLWRDNRNKEWRDQGAFGILDSFHFRDVRTVGRYASFAEQSSVFRWGSVLFASFDSGYLKRIDYGLARSLTATARRLYRFLDKHFHPPHRTSITIDVARLAYQHIGISPNVELDKVRKRHLAPAAAELEQAGYLKAVGKDGFSRIGRGKWQVTFEREMRRDRKSQRPIDETGRIIDALCRRGVSTATALALAACHKAGEVKAAAEAFDEQVRSGRVIRSADGWFTAALRNGYQASASSQRSRKRPERRVFRGPRHSA